MKIGLMGGTFNPVHIAHLRIAEEARECCSLDRVFFIPAADPPHKPIAGEITFLQRCAMVQQAIKGNRYFELSTVEGERSGKSYSIDTIKRFVDDFPDDSLYFIIGSDSFLEIGLWHCYESIFSLCNIIVVERPGAPVTDQLHALPAALRSQFEQGSESNLTHQSGKKVHFTTGCPIAVSSSKIRALAAAGRSIKYLVPPDAEMYITKKRIYK
ncbi:MAG: nicotinate (nicotinamide) nucleotide adenylyltransferase [Geobacteraceae bacterium GWC2_48_7]|nr:MAG: nicotinate (nicotinamide) nucleotide adenylyltransferase [Geobacteraceae bacterium GWC2_48_7]